MKLHYCCCCSFIRIFAFSLIHEQTHNTHIRAHLIGIVMHSMRSLTKSISLNIYIYKSNSLLLWMGIWTVQVEKLDKFACINFTAWKKKIYHFKVKTLFVSISHRLHVHVSNFNVFFVVFGTWFVLHSNLTKYSLNMCEQMFKTLKRYQSIDAMHTKLVCSIIVSIYFLPFSPSNIYETWCLRYLSSFKYHSVVSNDDTIWNKLNIQRMHFDFGTETTIRKYVEQMSTHCGIMLGHFMSIKRSQSIILIRNICSSPFWEYSFFGGLFLFRLILICIDNTVL